MRKYSAGRRGTPRNDFVIAVAFACALALVLLLTAFLLFQVFVIASDTASLDEHIAGLFFAAAGLLLSIFIAAATVAAMIGGLRAVGRGQLDEEGATRGGDDAERPHDA